MKKNLFIFFILVIVGCSMISVALFLEKDSKNSLSNAVVENFDVKSIAMATSGNILNLSEKSNDFDLKEVKMEVVPASIVRVEVYDHMTIEELSAKLNRSLKGYIAGQGEFIAKQCLEKGVDPYVAVAIMLHETGCNAHCSKLVRFCNNVAGQKGSPHCGNGSYKAFPTLKDGIVGFINNLSRNYYGIGLNTVDKIAPKYAEGNTWAGKIKYYVNKIKNN